MFREVDRDVISGQTINGNGVWRFTLEAVIGPALPVTNKTNINKGTETMSGYFFIKVDIKRGGFDDHTKFGNYLALRLLDIIYGREFSCTPDPVPCDGGEHWMIGHPNNHFLRYIGEHDGVHTYRISARYERDKDLDSLLRIIIH